MANKSKFVFLFTLMFIFVHLLVSESENILYIALIERCEGKRSETWYGICSWFSSSKCNKQCIQWEYATYGACHGFVNRHCDCYFDCNY
uniref:Defensin-2 n=1 Tax=Ceanothus thyrsiflorus TaxID=48245 RepID=A0A3Q8UAX4_CEATH|nr:defensin-2 [Ceanothus thyrsiflorus]